MYLQVDMTAVYRTNIDNWLCEFGYHPDMGPLYGNDLNFKWTKPYFSVYAQQKMPIKG